MGGTHVQSRAASVADPMEGPGGSGTPSATALGVDLQRQHRQLTTNQKQCWWMQLPALQSRRRTTMQVLSASIPLDAGSSVARGALAAETHVRRRAVSVADPMDG